MTSTAHSAEEIAAFFRRVEVRAAEHGFSPDPGFNGNYAFNFSGRAAVLQLGEESPDEVRLTVFDLDTPEDDDPEIVGWWAALDLRMDLVMRAFRRALDHV